jgi:hypothetical protein
VGIRSTRTVDMSDGVCDVQRLNLGVLYQLEDVWKLCLYVRVAGQLHLELCHSFVAAGARVPPMALFHRKQLRMVFVSD